MDNKLPQEIWNKIYEEISGMPYEPDGIDKHNATNQVCRIAQSHYEPIIAEKDTTIKELETELERVKGLLKQNVIERVNFRYPQDPTERIQLKKRVWDNFCKSNNINP